MGGAGRGIDDRVEVGKGIVLRHVAIPMRVIVMPRGVGRADLCMCARRRLPGRVVAHGFEIPAPGETGVRELIPDRPDVLGIDTSRTDGLTVAGSSSLGEFREDGAVTLGTRVRSDPGD